MRELQLQNNNSSSEAQAKQSFFVMGLLEFPDLPEILNFAPILTLVMENYSRGLLPGDRGAGQ